MLLDYWNNPPSCRCMEVTPQPLAVSNSARSDPFPLQACSFPVISVRMIFFFCRSLPVTLQMLSFFSEFPPPPNVGFPNYEIFDCSRTIASSPLLTVDI